MKNLFIIDRIENDIVIMQSLETEENINVFKSFIVGEIKEKNVYLKENDKYIYSPDETKKRLEYINNLTKGLWR